MSGRDPTENRVPQRNVIGRITRLENRFSVADDLANRPAATPSRANVTQDRNTPASSSTPKNSSGVRTSPMATMMRHPISPLTIPTTAFPKTIDDVCMGQRMSSSKLVWNSLWIIIFWEEDAKPAVMEVIATIPGIAYAT